MSRVTTVRGTLSTRIGAASYYLRHPKALVLFVVMWVIVAVPTLLWRTITGQNLFGGGRSTDATFTRRAVSTRKGWWNNLPGVKRAALRCCGVAVLWLWTIAPVVVYILLGLELVVVALSTARRLKEELHERRMLRPVWPAVAGIIGIPEVEPPSRWLDIPESMRTDPTAPDAEITVGLRAADADDERRVEHLVALFDQRFGVPHHGTVDYAARLVHIRVRQPEPYCWPAVANILGLDASRELAGNWLDIPDELDAGAVITVYIPQDAVSITPFSTALTTLINQQFKGEWAAKVEPAQLVPQPRPACVRLIRKAPKPTPPKFVDFLAEHPDYQEAN
jgi:hypothetical protein